MRLVTGSPPPPCRLALTGSVALLLTLGGCQSYEPKPLDLESHRAAFLARTLESQEVTDFAQSLSSTTGVPMREFNPQDGVSLAEAEAIAIVFNADLRLARLRAGVTQARVENAGLWEDPTIGVDLTRILESTPNPWKVFSSIGLTIPLSGRLEIEKERAGFEHAADLARIVEAEWELRMALRRAWSEWSALDARLTASRDFLSRVEQIVGIVDAMERAGEMARTEARLFRVEQLARRTDSVLLESHVATSLLTIKQLMGISPDAEVRLEPVLSQPHERTSLTPEQISAMRDSLATRSPMLLVARTEYEIAERQLELEVRKQYPDLHIGPGYGREDGQDQLLLGLSVPLPILNGNRQGIAEANAARELSRVEVEVLQERVMSALSEAIITLQAASTQRDTLESDLVPMVDAQYADAREIARLGEVNTLVLLESLGRQYDAKLRLIDAVRSETQAVITIDALIGPPERASEESSQ